MDEPKVDEIQRGALHMGKLMELEHLQRSWRATIPAGVKIEDILQPTFWRHFWKSLKPNDFINAMWEDGTKEADLRVRFVSKGEVKVVVRQFFNYSREEDIPRTESESHEVKWKGPVRKWCVVLKNGGDIVHGELETKEQAAKYLETHILALAS